jgi:hypothetical protein
MGRLRTKEELKKLKNSKTYKTQRIRKIRFAGEILEKKVE